MTELIANVSLLEWIAVAGGLGYVLLAAREHIACWVFAVIGTGASIAMLWRVDLLMDTALNGFYLVMAVYGYWQWRYGGNNKRARAIRVWPASTHVGVIVGIVGLSLMFGYGLSQTSQAAWPYLDSATTVAAIVTTYMVATKVLENWLYWVVIDAVSIWIYVERGIYLYALLFIAYTVIALYGYWHWRRRYQQGAQ